MAKNRQFLENDLQKIYVFGQHSALAAIKNPKRKIKKAIITEEFSNKIDKNLLKKVKHVEIVSKKQFDAFCKSKDNKNQGIALEAYYPKNFELSKILSNNTNTLIIMLDQIQDPQNIGSIMRSAALFGCNYIITSKDNSPDLNSSIIKAASGGAEIVDYVKVQNLSRNILEIKKHGFWVVGLDQNSKVSIDKFDIPKKCLLVIGSEHLGLRNLTKKNCDYLVSIKAKKNNVNIDSLNVANATTIALYECFKKL